mgnify:FL=1
MAASARRIQSNREMTGSPQRRDYTNTYIDGNVIRHVQAVPERKTDRRSREQTQRRAEASRQARRNREKALRMNVPYVSFLTAVSVATVFVCVNFLQLQSEGISYRNKIASLESQLTELKLANDNAYEDAVSSVDMEEVKRIAVNELGMTYADEGQIILYNNQEGDYIRQYAEVPTE